MAKSSTERSRERRARLKGTVAQRKATNEATLLQRVATLEREVALLKAVERRLQALEDAQPRFRGLIKAGAESPLASLRARIDQVVTRTDQPATVTPTFDPRTLSGSALRDYVRRYGPIPTDDPGDAA